MDPRLAALLSQTLLLDLEVGADGALHKIGALRGEVAFLRQGRFDERAALAELERFAGDASFILGHNLLGHDLPVLRARASGLGLLAALDRLWAGQVCRTVARAEAMRCLSETVVLI
ncbi:hypothetical protein [Thiococcus pfennigii]|uniref:hypothetical protein n=1 Tax=Thiococcus pfennigii TaxID=1057 RepID=UPI001907FF80|nr:hypothetical protein [Thiococcus pfennigii]MBK1731660.1 hypothetical protein [Thiococcus pfennigii]